MGFDISDVGEGMLALRMYSYVTGMNIQDTKNINQYSADWNTICQLFAKMRQYNIEPYTMEQFAMLSKNHQSYIKGSKPYILAAKLNGNQRSKGNVISYSMLIYDLDEIDWNVVKTALAIDANRIVYSTFSHKEEKPKIRVVLPCSVDIPVSKYEAVSRIVGEALFGIDNLDFHSWTVSQGMYMPHYLKDSPVIFDVKTDGYDIPIDEIMTRFSDVIDTPSRWPLSSRERSIGVVPKVRPVYEKKDTDVYDNTPSSFGTTGWRGVWNAVYTIPDVIEKYDLPFAFSRSGSNGDEYWSYLDAVHHPNGCVLSTNGTRMWIYNANCPWENTMYNDGHQLDAFAMAGIYLTGGAMDDDAVEAMIEEAQEDDACQEYVRLHGIPGDVVTRWQAFMAVQSQIEERKKINAVWDEMMLDMGGLHVNLQALGISPDEVVRIVSVDEY